MCIKTFFCEEALKQQ